WKRSKERLVASIGRRKFARLHLLEPSLVTLGLQLFEYRGIQRGRWCLTSRRSPITLVDHGLDQLLTVHGLARLAQHLGGRAEAAQLPLALGLFLLTTLLLALGFGRRDWRFRCSGFRRGWRRLGFPRLGLGFPLATLALAGTRGLTALGIRTDNLDPLFG